MLIRDAEIADFYNINMRDHEAGMNLSFVELLDLSNESKTVIKDGEILTIYGIFFNNGLWQIPSKAIEDKMFFYARNCQKPIRDMVKGKNVYSLCLSDDLHDRWMKFIGFVKVGMEDGLSRWEINNGH